MLNFVVDLKAKEMFWFFLSRARTKYLHQFCFQLILLWSFRGDDDGCHGFRFCVGWLRFWVDWLRFWGDDEGGHCLGCRDGYLVFRSGQGSFQSCLYFHLK